jgi:threonine synthase
MHFYNINKPSEKVSFRQSVLQGAASGKGLYFPERIPTISRKILDEMDRMELWQMAREVMQPFVEGDFSEKELEDVCRNAFNFPIPLVPVADRLYSLELYHGPSLAFKDVGARFLSQVLRKFSDDQTGEITVLVATSGDTGSAVAQSFLHVDGIRVVLLYPSGKVSKLQEQTLTAVGGNVKALEIEGTFDDCQRLVKQAFADEELTSRMTLTSANSINIGRFLPQSVYYFWAWAQLPPEQRNNILVSVPGGNYGNLSAGLMAWKMGLPVRQFVASSNVNRVVPDYLETGTYEPRQSVRTLSNAMDVGDPSNFVRITELFDQDHSAVKRQVKYHVADDSQTRHAISQVYSHRGYILDPHGAVSFLGCQAHQEPGQTAVFLETAHPAKFQDAVQEAIGQSIDLPAYLRAIQDKEKQALRMPVDYKQFKNWLIRTT